MGCTCFVITLGPLSVWRLSADLSPSLCPVVGLVTAFRAVRRLSTQMLSTPFAEGSYMDISILWLPSHILGICSSWKLMLGHKMILYFSHRIASEYMMVISSGLQCLCLLTLDLCYFCQLSTPATGHWPWTDWDDTALQSIYCRYGETEAVMCVMIVVTGVCGTWSSIWILDRSA